MNKKTIMDIEAAGFKSYPIEIGIIRSDGKSYCKRIIPIEKWETEEWDEEAEKTHNISKKDLLNTGISAYEIANEINDFLKEDAYVLIETDYDLFWLKKLFDDCKIEIKFKIKMINDEHEEICYHWYAIKERMSKGNKKLHNSLVDARIMQKSLKIILDELKK